ncbi:chemotaxis protein CheA [Halostella sp. JP-L12]|uniref:chemotaxis protein CheA n=1 Tax=Halostella TaxID=1843185 RepID=UPI000EF829EC|nr:MULTISPECIES: chemotaxis protein CheA [Halostella]NHN49550.1 chemotaxis protein CheA [Halostella sp. JP-L12]
MDEYVRDFVQESEENITALNNALLRLENDPDDDAAMEEIFRTAHTLKGNCGAMGFSDASDLAHALEDLLEEVRTGSAEVTPDLMDQVFEGVDLLEGMIDEVRRHGEPRTDPSATIDALREHGDAGGIADPDDDEVRDLLSSVNRPADAGHDVYHVRLAIAEGDVNNGVLVVEALRDAFDLLGTDPSEDVIEDDDYGSAFDAAFASPVGEAAISAALEPVDAVEEAIITDATAIAAETADAPAADEADDGGTAEATDASAAEADATDSEDMSVDDLLADEEVDQFDDLDSMVDEVEDMEGLDDLGDAGSFADIDADPDVSTVADADADPADDEPDVDELLDEAESEVEAADAESEPGPDEEVEDASSTFAELKEEVDPVGFDELQDELEELEFDELDGDDEVGFDELLGEDADAPEPELDGDEEIDVEAEFGLDDGGDDLGVGADDDLGIDDGDNLDASGADDAFGDVAFGDDGEPADASADAGTDGDAEDAVGTSVDEPSVGDAPESASEDDAEDDPFGDIDFGEGFGDEPAGGDDESTESDSLTGTDDATAGGSEEPADDFGDVDFGTDTADDDATAAGADLGSTDADGANALDASADATADEPTDEGTAADAGDGVDTGEFGDLDLDDSGSAFDTSTGTADQFEGFQSPDTEESEDGADEAGDAAAPGSDADGAAADASADDADDGDGPRSAVDQSGPSTGSEEIQSVRVDVDKVDTLMNLVEGMVTSRVRLRRAIERGESLAVLDDELDELEDITGELQDTVMDIRLVPLNTVANKLPRIVRDISREQGKQVSFEMHGDDVEIDRSILNEIGDPLVHIVRNAVDHGIESPDEREDADKEPTGTIELRARRERDRVVIEIEDDGRGLDVDRLRREAVEQGVATESEIAEMDDDDVYDLIFHSGFSTTEEVTDVSGRGVGMDVVASTVDDLDGDVAVDSAPGEGTTVRLTLPVTVAIADVLFVQSGDEEYGIPIKDVKDIGPVRDVETVDGREVVVRGDEEDQSEYPLLRLGETLDTPGTHRNGDGMLVSIRDDVRPVALHCDEVRGQQEVVVKPYEGVLGDVPGLSGATVLGEGDVVNILDVESL